MERPALTGARSASRASSPSTPKVEAAAKARCLRPHASSFPPDEPEASETFLIAPLPRPAVWGSVVLRKISSDGGESMSAARWPSMNLPLRLALKAGNDRIRPDSTGRHRQARAMVDRILLPAPDAFRRILDAGEFPPHSPSRQTVILGSLSGRIPGGARPGSQGTRPPVPSRTHPSISGLVTPSP
jgi:hypothetical protein